MVAERGRPVTTGLGVNGRTAAAKWSPIENVVVDQAGHVDQLDRDCQPGRRQARRRVRAQSRTSIGRMRLPPAFRVATRVGRKWPVVVDRSRERAFDFDQPLRQPGSGAINNCGDRFRELSGRSSRSGHFTAE